MFFVADGVGDDIISHIGAADNFDDDIDIWRFGDRHQIGSLVDGRIDVIAVAACACVGDDQAMAASARQLIDIVFDEIKHACTDSTQTQYGDVDGFVHKKKLRKFGKQQKTARQELSHRAIGCDMVSMNAFLKNE